MTFVSHSAKEQGVVLTQTPQVPGLDTLIGLRCVQGRWDRYVELLQRYASNQAGTVDAIRSALSGGDWHAAARVAHTCKGVAATVGARAVADVAAWLESLIRRRQLTDRAVLALDSVLSEQLTSIQAWLDLHASHPAKVTTAEVAQHPAHLVALLVQMLDSNDALAPQFLQQHAAVLRNALPLHFDQLRAAVQDFDYRLALRFVSDAGVYLD